MKYFLLVVCMLFGMGLSAQDDYANPDYKKNTVVKKETKKNEPFNSEYRKGMLMVDFHVGTPAMVGFFYKTIADSIPGITQLKKTHFGPVVVRGEYLYKPRKSFGIEMSLATTTVKWEKEHTEYTADTNYTTGLITYNSRKEIHNNKINVFRYRFVPRYTYHFFWKRNPQLDTYFSAGLGIGRFITTGEGPSYYELLKEAGIFKRNRYVFLVRFGARYLISDKAGLNFEMGSGGPFLSFGFFGAF